MRFGDFLFFLFCTGHNPDVADWRHDLIIDKVALNSGEEEAT